MATATEKERINALINREGVFGLGFSNNNNLDLLNLIVLACAGIIIKIFFQENTSTLGNVGPASTTIWGYGLTSLALFLMIFMSLYLTKRNGIEDKKANILETEGNFFTELIKLLMNDSLPIILTLGIVIWIIYLNFTYFERINKGNVTDSYHTYSFFSSMLLIIQVGLIIKYMFNLLARINKVDVKMDTRKQTEMIKSVSYILVVINFVFVMIINILLAFFSTDG